MVESGPVVGLVSGVGEGSDAGVGVSTCVVGVLWGELEPWVDVERGVCCGSALGLGVCVVNYASFFPRVNFT